MTQAQPPSFMGIPIAYATVEQIRWAILNGRLLWRNADWACYQHGNKVFILPQTDGDGEIREKS